MELSEDDVLAAIFEAVNEEVRWRDWSEHAHTLAESSRQGATGL